MPSNEDDFSHIVDYTASKLWKAELDKIDKTRDDALLTSCIVDEFGNIMGPKQCACTHLFMLHGEPSSPLTIRTLQLAVKALKGQYIVRKCMACSCQEFETDNLEWLLKRKKWAR